MREEIQQISQYRCRDHIYSYIVFILASPVFGFVFVGFLIGIAILITGIQILIARLRGRKVGFEPPTMNTGQ